MEAVVVEGMKIHSAAELMPEMTPEEFAELKEGIKAHGLRYPIILLDGAILDGRSRYRALKELGLLVDTKMTGGGRPGWQWDFCRDATPEEAADPITFVWQTNLNRRHLTNAQKKELALKLLPAFEEQARQRQEAARFQSNGDGERKNTLTVVEGGKGKATAQAAKAVGLSTSTVEKAKRRRLNGEVKTTIHTVTGLGHVDDFGPAYSDSRTSDNAKAPTNRRRAVRSLWDFCYVADLYADKRTQARARVYTYLASENRLGAALKAMKALSRSDARIVRHIEYGTEILRSKLQLAWVQAKGRIKAEDAAAAGKPVRSVPKPKARKTKRAGGRR